MILWLWDLDQRPPNLFFWPQAVPALLFYFSGLVPGLSNLPFTTDLNSCTQLHILSYSFSALSASCARQSCWWCRSFISPTISSACVMKAVVMAAQTGPPRMPGEGDWSGFRKGIGTRRGSLLNLAKNFSFLSFWYHFLLLGPCTCNPHRIS